MDLQLGYKIKLLADKKRITTTELADAVGTGERNMYKLYKSDDMYVSQVYKLSKRLGFNFLTEVSEKLQKEINNVLNYDGIALIKEPEPVYKKKKTKPVTIKFEVEYDLENADSLGRFLMYVDDVAEKLGFRLK